MPTGTGADAPLIQRSLSSHMATGAVSHAETLWYHGHMRQSIHRFFTPVWRWLCLTYACLGVTVMTGRVHLGVWLPGAVPETAWGLVWLVCAAGAWQGKYTSVRGSLSILAPALSMMSYGLDFVTDMLSLSLAPIVSLTDLAHCVMWGSICMLINTITRLDQPGS